MNKEETLKLLSLITTAYPTLELTEERIELWQTMMADVPLQRALQNVREHIETSDFPPTISKAIRPRTEETMSMFDYEVAHQKWVRNGGDPEAFVHEPHRKRLS